MSGPTSIAPTRRDIAVLGLLVAVVRFAYVADRTTVSLSPDEFSSLAIGRFLSGGEFNMLVASTYRSLPGVLLVPWSWLFDDPSHIVRLGLATNAVIAGATMLLFVPLVTRMTSFGRRGALLVSGLIGVLPQSLESSAHLWAEPLVSLTFLGTLLALLRHLDRPRPTTAVVALAWSALASASHGRLLPLVAITVAVVVVDAVVRRRFALAALGVLSATGMLGGVTWFHRWIVSNVWELPGSGNSERTVLRRLGKPLEVLDAAAGQTWYQLAASGLLVAFGVIELVRRVRKRALGNRGRDAWVVLGLTAPIVGVSFVFMSDVARTDHVLYGRYIDAVIWPVIAVGADWLFHVRPLMTVRRRRFTMGAVVIVFVELGLLVHQLHRHQIRGRGINAMIGGIVPFTDRGSVHAPLVTGLVLLVAALLLWSARASIRDRRVWSAVIVALVATAGVRLWVEQRPDANRPATGIDARAILDLPDRPPLGTEIGVSLMPDDYGPNIARLGQLFNVYSFQLYLPEYRFVFDNGPFDEVGPYVFAVDNDALLTREGGTIVWEHPYRAMALWKERTDPAG